MVSCGLSLLAAPARAFTGTYTGSPFNFCLPTDDSFDWGECYNFNWTVINSSFTSMVTSTTSLRTDLTAETAARVAADVTLTAADATHAALTGTSAHSAASANTASQIVARDGSGNFAAGTITASLTGAASLNVLKAGDTMTGTLAAPDLTLTYGVNAATASFSSAITGVGSLSLSGSQGVQASSFTALYGIKAATASFSGAVTGAGSISLSGSQGVQASSFTALYGVSAATASFSGAITGPGSISVSGAEGIQGSSITAVYGVKAATAVVTYAQVSSMTATSGMTSYGTGISIRAASGVATSGQGFLDLTLAGWGSASTSYIGNVSAGAIGHNVASGLYHRFYINNVEQANFEANANRLTGQLTLSAGSPLNLSGAGGNVISASSITTTSGLFGASANLSGLVTASSITTTGGTGIRIQAASGQGTSGQGYLDFTQAGYGPTSGTVQWIGNVGNILAHWASGTHRFYVNAAGSGIMDITTAGIAVTGTTATSGSLTVGSVTAGSGTQVYRCAGGTQAGTLYYSNAGAGPTLCTGGGGSLTATTLFLP